MTSSTSPSSPTSPVYRYPLLTHLLCENNQIDAISKNTKTGETWCDNHVTKCYEILLDTHDIFLSCQTGIPYFSPAYTSVKCGATHIAGHVFIFFDKSAHPMHNGVWKMHSVINNILVILVSQQNIFHYY